MFKVYQLEIMGIGSFFNKTTLTFSPFLTFLRGANGIGKTTILEALAMLGHCCVMKYRRESTSQRYIRYTVVLGECPFDGDEEIGELAKDWKEFLGSKPFREVTVTIALKDNEPQSDLRTYLNNEELLEIECEIIGEEASVNLLKNLVAFSRPKQASLEIKRFSAIFSDAFQASQELNNINGIIHKISECINRPESVFLPTSRSKHIEYQNTLPPFISYFNTDMYQSGLGLNIRGGRFETIAHLVKDRLCLVNDDGEMMNFNLLQEFWNLAYATSNYDLDMISFKGSEVAISVKDEISNGRTFITSWEYQLICLGILFGTLKPRHSIIMLDEPDLHLFLPDGIQLYQELFFRSFIDDNQAIVTTHMPFGWPESIHETILPKSIHKKDNHGNIEEYRRCYLQALDHKSAIVDAHRLFCEETKKMKAIQAIQRKKAVNAPKPSLEREAKNIFQANAYGGK